MVKLRRTVTWFKEAVTAPRILATGILILGISAVTSTTVAMTDEQEEDARQDFFIDTIVGLEADLDAYRDETDCRARLAVDVDVVRAQVTMGLSEGLIILVTHGAESPELELHILYLQELNTELLAVTQRRDNAIETCEQEE